MAHGGRKQILIKASPYGPSRGANGYEMPAVVATNERTKNVVLPKLTDEERNIVRLHGARPRKSPFAKVKFSGGDGLLVRTIDPNEPSIVVERVAIVCDVSTTAALYVREWLDGACEWGPVRKLHRKDISRTLRSDELAKKTSGK